MKALIFGAGNIARALLGVLLHQSGAETTFVDIDQEKINSVNKYKEYPVFTLERDVTSEYLVRDVSAIHLLDGHRLTEHIINADVILTAIGKNQLPKIAPMLSKGLRARMAVRSDPLPLFLCACENAHPNTTVLWDSILEHTPHSLHNQVKGFVSHTDCVVDKIVPNAPEEILARHPLALGTEAYHSWIIDEKNLVASLPKISGLETTRNIDAALARKLFGLNGTHAAIAYWGKKRGCESIAESLSIPDISTLTQGLLAEIEELLVSQFGFSAMSQREYSKTVLRRFSNPYLNDSVSRVGREPKRKLGSEDRLVLPARLLERQRKPSSFLPAAIAAGLHFEQPEDNQAIDLQTTITKTGGIGKILQSICHIKPDSKLGKRVTAMYHIAA